MCNYFLTFTKIKRLDILSNLSFLERVMRIELTTTAWEAVVLPLNYTRTSEQTSLSAIWVNTQISTSLRCSSSFPKNLATQSFSGVLFSFFQTSLSAIWVNTQISMSLINLYDHKFYLYYYFSTKLLLLQTEFCILC